MKLEVAKDGKHKYVAVFYDGQRVPFGARGYTDFTLTGDKDARQRYIARHKSNEDWNNPRSAGALAKRLVWGDSRSVAENTRAFNRRFGL